MSYRAFKRLFGETSLERKCRFWLGTVTLLLITASFWVYARLTENLAYEATLNSGRLLAPQIMANKHVESAETRTAIEEFQRRAEKQWPEGISSYGYRIIKPNARKAENKPDGDERDILDRFLADPDKAEETRGLRSGENAYYYGAIRASSGCLHCHKVAADDGEDQSAALNENDLMAVVRIKLSSQAIQEDINLNKALLLTAAFVTSSVIMVFTWLIVRYVIVKPVKHLKDVSDAIAAGELNVRSEINSGDEFEDLSHSFNRMLRNLVQVQDRLKTVNVDLDRKVDELARANMALYESNRLKSDFLATMSHELRTPLNSILGFSEVLLSSPQLNDKQQRWVGNIQSSGSQLLSLINDLLDLAKIEAGKMELRPETFAVEEVTDRLEAMFRPMAERKQLDLRCAIAPGVPPLRQDAGKLHQILSNLLSNALKFTPEGGRVLLKAEAEGPRVVLTVSDTGVGIAPEDQEAVFEKFRQAAHPLTREYAGTGLGLSIVRELSKLLGGEVTLRSELGRGSTFTVRLPIDLGDVPASADRLPETTAVVMQSLALAGTAAVSGPTTSLPNGDL